MLEAGFVIREVTAPSGQAEALIVANALNGPALEAHTAALATVSAQAKRLETRGGTLILLQDTGGRFQPDDERAWRSGLTGLARTAAQEFPKALVRAIDVDIADLGARSASDRVVEELLSGGTAPCIGLSAKGRLGPVELALGDFTPQTAQIGPQDVILVTGGARGVTADCIIELARQTGARFALLGRSEITPWPADLDPSTDQKALRGALAARAKAAGEKITPAALNAQARALLSGAEIRATLTAIEQAGGTALYLQADVANPTALTPALRQVEQSLGPITGLVHGAGVLADKRIAEKTADQVAKVFTPKIAGLETLLSQIDVNELKTIAFFSSVAARYGNVGQADYAMANEVLNRMAQKLKAAHPDATVTSLGWGPWDGGMVDATLKAKFAEMGISLIPREAGAKVFTEALLAGRDCPVELIIGSEIAHG
ncbi:SDR family NAD(P)-dependent oxidoreductase [Henriciella aquimarina]|uniref:SDR family NAD(P)-dependent oxidoreductase n=1 Tax=Henriciella aquimarina TaxID=545261 RepID=UPI000A008F91|nr:SDR family NAD(P)-dependent oxidoreductase [Henriciella aquimarina]